MPDTSGIIELPAIEYPQGKDGLDAIRKVVNVFTEEQLTQMIQHLPRYDKTESHPYLIGNLHERVAMYTYSMLYYVVGKIQKYSTAVSCTSRESYIERHVHSPDIYYDFVGRSRSYIDIGRPDDKRPANEHMRYTGAAYLIGLMLRDWELNLSPIRMAPKNDKIDEIAKANKVELYILCKTFIPEPLASMLSMSRAAMLLALLTGHVITEEQDISTNDEILSNLVPIPITYLDNLAYGYAKSEQVYNIQQISDYTTCCDILSTPEIAPVVNLCKQAVNTVKAYNPKLYSANRLGPEINVTDVINVLDSLGSNYRLYHDRDNPIECLIDVRWQMEVAYLLHKYYHYPRRPLTVKIPYRELLPAGQLYVLSCYSDNELVSFYQPFADIPKRWISYRRSELITNIKSAYARKPELDIHNEGPCYNDDTIHLINAERRGDVRVQYEERNGSDDEMKNEDVDPFIRYGFGIRGGRRRCFQASELLLSFRETEYGFEFIDPDWTPVLLGEPEQIDPLTDKPIQRTFDLRVIKDLQHVLWNFIDGDRRAAGTTRPLFRHIKEGLRQMQRNSQDIDRIRLEVGNKPEWRNDLLIYFSWVFLFAMWIRFWKGPGTPYPAAWVDLDEGEIDYMRRDQHIAIELTVHGNMLLKLEQRSPELAEYIKKLPYFYYNWVTTEITQPLAEVAEELVGASLIEKIIDKVQLDDFCMAQATDLLSGSAFVYLTRVMNVPVERLDDLLVQVMWLLQNLEQQAIDSRLLSIFSMQDGSKKQEAMTVIEEHKKILLINGGDGYEGVGLVQPPLDISKVTTTGHLPDAMEDVLEEPDEEEELEEPGEELDEELGEEDEPEDM